MGGVGNGTTLDYIQSSYGGDDAFEWFGGTVNAKHLVSFSTWDDDFDTDFGYSGNVQFGLIIRYPFYADQSGSNAFESDNQGNANATNGCDFTVSSGAVTGGTSAGCTKAVFSNVTVLGPRDFSARAISGNFQNAMHIRRRTNISIFNSFLSGFPTGLRLDDDATIAAYNSGLGKLANNVLLVPSTKELGTTSGEVGAVYSSNVIPAGGNAASAKTVWTAANSNNVIEFTTASTLWGASAGTNTVIAPYVNYGISPSLFWGGGTVSAYPANPNFALTSGTLATGASFSDALVAGAFFDKAGTFKGAFGASDWTDTWTEFQALTKAY
jgi:hypothetical protein